MNDIEFGAELFACDFASPAISASIQILWIERDIIRIEAFAGSAIEHRYRFEIGVCIRPGDDDAFS